MSSTIGGRWIFSVDTSTGFSGVTLGMNNSVLPVFPTPLATTYNIEVFTSPQLSNINPVNLNLSPGFNAAIIDTNGALDNGLLAGYNLALTNGDFLAVDYGNGCTIRMGTGRQTVVGGQFDTIVGGAGDQIISALLGNETIVGGSANTSIWGGSNDSIWGGTGPNQQTVITGSNTIIYSGLGGGVISAAPQNTVKSLVNGSSVVIASAGNNLIDLTANIGSASAVIGAVGDTIISSYGITNVDGSAGGMKIQLGASSAGTLALSGSTNPAAGNTVTSLEFISVRALGFGVPTGGIIFNPGPVAGKGDYINLSGGTLSAQINSFSFQGTRIASPDTILATSTSDSIFGGDGDRIGTAHLVVVQALVRQLPVFTNGYTPILFPARQSDLVATIQSQVSSTIR